MKKVVMLGDSIRQIGYGQTVAKALEGEFQVWQPEGNNRYAKYTFREIFEFSEINGADIVHWNNGLWDLNIYADGLPLTPIEHYVYDMTRIAKLLQSKAKTVIFATTTPVREENTRMLNSNIEAYNAAVVPALRELGVVINDLYAPVSKNIDRYICDDLTHLSEEGIKLCADLVEKAIRQQAQLL